MVTSAFHPPEEVKKKKIVRKTKKVRFKKNSSKKQKTAHNLSTEKPPKKKKKKTTGRPAARKLTGKTHLDKSNSEPGSDKPKKEDQSQTPADEQKKEESAIPAKSTKFKKKKAHSSSTDTSDEEYKAMVAAGIIRKPEKKKSLQQTEEFRPKTEQELLDFFLARHNADKPVSKPQQKVVETPDKPLSKREMFRQHFDAKAKEKEGEVKEIKASDYFPLALAAEEIQKAKAKKGGKSKKKKVKKKKKGNKSKQLTAEKGSQNKLLPQKARKKKTTASKNKKKSKAKKLLEAEDPLDEVLHDVTIVVDEPQKTTKKQGKKIKKKRKKKKKKGKNQELPSHLQKLIDKISGEVEICAGFEDHDVGVSRNVTNVADDEEKHVPNEGRSSELAKVSGTAEDTKKSENLQKKKEIRFKTKRSSKNQPKKTKITQKPIVTLPSSKLSHYPWNSSTDDDVKKFERIWVEVTGPNLQVEEFSADLNSRLMRAPPGTNLSLMQLFSAEEMKGVTRVADNVEASKDETNFLALEQMGRIQTMIDFYITPIEIFQDNSKHGQRQSVDSSGKSSRRAWNSRSPSPRNNVRQKSPQKAEYRMNPPRRQQLLSQRSAHNTRLFKVKRKKHSNSQEKEYQDAATLEADTQIENLTASGISKISEEADDGGPARDSAAGVSSDERTLDSTGKHVTFQSSTDSDDQLTQEKAFHHDERAIQQRRPQQLDEELDYDMLRDLQAQLKEGIRIILTKGTPKEIQREIQALRIELVRRKEVDSPDILSGNPRVYDKSMVRYELPMDITKLEGLTPLQYLKEYSFVSEPLKNLHATVYRRHFDLQKTRDFSLADLTVAMTEIMGNCWSPDDSEVVCKILGLSVQKAGPSTEVLSVSAAISVLDGETAEAATSSESLKESSPSQLSGLDTDPNPAVSSSQSTLRSNCHHRSLSSPLPDESSASVPNASIPRLIDLLKASRERRLGEHQNLAEQARKESVSEITALRSTKSDPPAAVTSLLDLNQFHAVAALAERLFCTEYAKFGKNEVKNKEYVEIADFERLQQKLSYISVSDELRDLLFLIKNS